MPLSGALFSSVSGLDATSTAISVVGDNIANVNTTGFKSRRTEFADVLGQSISTAGGFSQIGAGSKVSNIRTLFTQGTFETTNRSTDVAIEGRGFFIVDGPQGRAYSRAGIFNFDDEGFLVNPEGRLVQGYGIDPVTNLSNGQLGDIQISNAIAPPRPTSLLNFAASLDADATLIPGGFDPADPTATSSHTAVVSVYDSLGRQQNASLFFTQTAAGSWEWNLTLPTSATTIAPVNPTDDYVVQGSGVLSFNTDGNLTAATGTTFNLEFSGGATPAQAMTLNFGPIGGTGTGDPTRAYSVDDPTRNDSSTISFSQDGFGAGFLQTLRIGSDGYLTGSFSNGETIPLAQLALATFPNLEGLQAIGNTNLVETRESGQPLIGQPQTGSLGSIRSSSLEQSNVDLATEFVRLIINQRAFQANTRTISTTNELLGDLVNLGR